MTERKKLETERNLKTHTYLTSSATVIFRPFHANIGLAFPLDKYIYIYRLAKAAQQELQ